MNMLMNGMTFQMDVTDWHILPSTDEERVLRLSESMPEVLECHHITGQDCFLLKIGATSIPHLEQVIGKFSDFTHTVTTIVLS